METRSHIDILGTQNSRDIHSIRMGSSVPDGDVNLAYVYGPELNLSKAISISDYSTNIIGNYTKGQDYLALPDAAFMLHYTGGTLFKTDNVEITDEFSVYRDSASDLIPLYYRTTLSKSIDITKFKNKSNSNELFIYKNGYMKYAAISPAIGNEDTIVYSGNKFEITVSNKDIDWAEKAYKVILRKGSSAGEYNVDVYSNFKSEDDDTYYISYTDYNGNAVKEILNLNTFFIRSYSASSVFPKLSPTIKISDSNIVIAAVDGAINFNPYLRINNNGMISSLKITDTNGTISLSPRLRINNGGDITELTISSESIENLVEAYQDGTNDETCFGYKEYAASYVDDCRGYNLFVPTQTLITGPDNRPGQIFKYQVTANLNVTYGEDNQKTVYIGVYNFNTSGVGRQSLAPFMYNFLRSGTPGYLKFDNPNHPENISIDDDDYWMIDLDEPTESLSVYDIIIIAGYGTLDLTYCGANLINYIENGGRVWIDNCANGTDAIQIIWPENNITSINFSADPLQIAGLSGIILAGDAKYSNRYYKRDDIIDVVPFTPQGQPNPISAKVIIPLSETSSWTKILGWNDSVGGFPMALGKRKIGNGALYVSNCAMVRNTITYGGAKSYFAINLLLCAIEEVTLRSPKIAERIIHINNLFDEELITNNDDGTYYHDMINLQSSPIVVAKKLLAATTKEALHKYISSEYKASTGTYSIKVYNTDNTPCETVVMTVENDGSEKLWAYSLRPDTISLNLSNRGFDDANVSIYYNTLEFDWSITTYAYELDQNTMKYRYLAGDTYTGLASINKEDGQVILANAAAVLPVVNNHNGAWGNNNNIFYHLWLGKMLNGVRTGRDIPVNLTFYNKKSGEYLYSQSGESDLFFGQLGKTYNSVNIHEGCNSHFEDERYSGVTRPEGWMNIECQTFMTTEGYDKGSYALYAKGSNCSVAKTPTKTLEPNTSYVLETRVYVVSGEPEICQYIGNEGSSVSKRMVADLGAKRGEWCVIQMPFTTIATNVTDYYGLLPIVMADAGELYLDYVDVKKVSLNNVANIAICAATNDYQVRASKKKFSVRELESRNIYVEQPASEDLRDPWYLRIHGGKFDKDFYPNGDMDAVPEACTYYVPEYMRQYYEPGFPYKKENSDRVVCLGPNTVQLNRKNIVDNSLHVWRYKYGVISVVREMLTVDELPKTYTSEHHGWASSGVKVEQMLADGSMQKISGYSTDLENGTITTNYEYTNPLYATYSCSDSENITIKEVDSNNGIIQINTSVGFNDEIYASYLYREEFYTYRGYYDGTTFWHLDLNPTIGHYITYPTILANSMVHNELVPTAMMVGKTITIYAIPYMINGTGAKTWTIKHTFGSFDSILSVEPRALKLAEVQVNECTNVEDTIIFDTRSEGGGLKKSITNAAIEDKYEAASNYWDIGPWDGYAYQSNGVLIVNVPKASLNEEIGMTDAKIQEYVEKYLAYGVFPILEYTTDEG